MRKVGNIRPRRPGACTRELSLVLLGLLVTLWSVQGSTYASSITGGVTVSVRVTAADGGGGSSSTSAVAGSSSQDRRSGGLRPQSLLLRIASNTFAATRLNRPQPQSGRAAQPPPGHPDSQAQPAPPAGMPADAGPTEQADAGPHPVANAAVATGTPGLCRARPFAAGCDPRSFCTLRSIHCIVLGISDDLYTVWLLSRTPLSPGIAWSGGRGGPPPGEPVQWLLFLLLVVIAARLAYRWLKHIGNAGEGTPTVSAAAGHVHTSGRWYAFNLGVVLTLSLLALFLLWESTGAQSAVGLGVIGTDIGMSCSPAVSLGTISGHGDTGAFDLSRATTCTVLTTSSGGYSLSWQVRTGSGGTSTGRLISENEDAISPYAPAVSGVPEAWSVAGSTSGWGGRLSSDSTTVSTGVWGTDGGLEKWLNIGTGSSTIAIRTSATSGGGDAEIIGFRAQVGAAANQPAGTYTATVVFTAVSN